MPVEKCGLGSHPPEIRAEEQLSVRSPYQPPASQRWVEINLTADLQSMDALSSRLIEWGSPGVVFSGEREETVRGCLPDDETLGNALADIRRFVDSLRRLGVPADVSTRPVPPIDWVRDFQERCVPREVGPFRIVPDFHATGPGSRSAVRNLGGRAAEIILTPAMAFGTGEHPTTRLCLKTLGEFGGGLSPGRVLDIGCGSGILGIAAAKWFPRCRVTSIDIDPGAYHATRDNARKNRVAGRMTVREGSLERTRGKFGLILANLYLEPLRDLAGMMARRLEKEGLAVLSGILVSQADALTKALSDVGLGVVRKLGEAGWICLTAGRNGRTPPPKPETALNPPHIAYIAVGKQPLKR